MRIKVFELPECYQDQDHTYPFKDGEHVLYLGEIENMPGHVTVVTRDGKVHWGYHPENFREPTEDEV